VNEKNKLLILNYIKIIKMRRTSKKKGSIKQWEKL